MTYNEALHGLLVRAWKAMNGDSNDAEHAALYALVEFLEEEHPDAATTEAESTHPDDRI
jgi:hypothetical protein